MDATAAGGVLRFFRDLPDPRTGNHVTHRLHDLIVIAVLAVICGADGWARVALWGRCKARWLATFLDLTGGIPSHDTFGRVFALLDPDAFERCFLAWAASVVELSGGRLVAVDGKSIRRSLGRGWDRSGMAHLVSAFVSQGDNRLVVARVAVPDKANEIGAIPRLLALLDLRGAVVTTDAVGCQRDIAGRIVAGAGDYLLPVKDNQCRTVARWAGESRSGRRRTANDQTDVSTRTRIARASVRRASARTSLGDAPVAAGAAGLVVVGGVVVDLAHQVEQPEPALRLHVLLKRCRDGLPLRPVITGADGLLNQPVVQRKVRGHRTLPPRLVKSRRTRA